MTATGRTNWASDINVERLRAIEILIRQKPMGTHQIAEVLGIGQKSVALAIQHIRDKVHVAEFAHRNGGIPLYSWGAAKDVKYVPRPPKPAPQPAEKIVPYNSRIARRDWGVEMVFGPAYVGLESEVRGMAA